MKVWDPSGYAKLKEDVILVLCDLEMYFPPAFFDVMTHLLVHIVEELDLYGPVSAHWMYPLERYMKLLKDHVWTYYRPEASMALGYIKDETMGFLTEYMGEFEHVKSRVWKAHEEEETIAVVLEGAATRLHITRNVRDVAHEYVLQNTLLMAPWCE